MEMIRSSLSGSSVIQFLVDHKWSMIASTAALLYGLYYLKRPRNLPPGPWGYPYIGSWLELTGDITGDMKRLAKKYGDLYCLYMGAGKYVIVINNLEILKEANLKSGADFADREPGYCFGGFEAVEPLFNGAYNDDHKFVRRVCVTSLRKFISSKLSQVLDSETDKLTKVLDASVGQPVFISTPIEQVLSNVFTALHFNQTYDLEDPELHNFVDGVEKWYFAFEDAYNGTLKGKTIFVPKPTSANVLLKGYHTFVKKKIVEHQKTIDMKNPRDLVDIFIKEGALNRLGVDLLANQIMELVPNGVYTASIVINWMFTYLMAYPQYYQAIFKEIDVLKGSQPVQIEDRPNMPLTEAFMLETLRLKTPLQISMATTTTRPTKLMGYSIPYGSFIVTSYVAIHEDPKVFPDPLTFKPERFIDNDGKIHIGEGFLVFGLGRRICVGEGLIKNLIFHLFATIVQRYHISPDPIARAQQNIFNNLIFKQESFHIVLEKREQFKV